MRVFELELGKTNTPALNDHLKVKCVYPLPDPLEPLPVVPAARGSSVVNASRQPTLTTVEENAAI